MSLDQKLNIALGLLFFVALVSTLDFVVDWRAMRPHRKSATLKRLVVEGCALAEHAASLNAKRGFVYTPSDKLRCAVDWALESAKLLGLTPPARSVVERMVEIELRSK